MNTGDALEGSEFAFGEGGETARIGNDSRRVAETRLPVSSGSFFAVEGLLRLSDWSRRAATDGQEIRAGDEVTLTSRAADAVKPFAAPRCSATVMLATARLAPESIVSVDGYVEAPVSTRTSTPCLWRTGPRSTRPPM